MNVLTDKWVRVLGDKGSELISISEIGRSSHQLNAPNWDVENGTLLLLIAIFQTYFAPTSDEEWWERFEEPPNSDQILEAVDDSIPYFNLFGDSHRFMQAPVGKRREAVLSNTQKRACELFTSEYGENGFASKNQIGRPHKDQHRFFFNETKNTPIKIHVSDLAPLLYNIHVSGALKQCGNGTSCVRGNGIPTCILKGKNLWETIWLNVLNEEEMFHLMGDPEVALRLPWVDSVRGDVGPHKVNPHTVLWWMIRDIHLPDPDEEGCITFLFSDVLDKVTFGPRGPKWSYGWIHPLSPRTQMNDDGNIYVRKLSLSDNVGDWTYFRFGIQPKDKVPLAKAPNVRACERRFRVLSLGNYDVLPPVRLYGTILDQAKMCGVIDTYVPLYSVSEEDEEKIVNAAHILTDYISECTKVLKRTLKGLSVNVRDDVWKEVTDPFHDLLRMVSEGKGDPEEKLKSIKGATLDVFDQSLSTGLFRPVLSKDRDKATKKIPILERDYLEKKINKENAKALAAFKQLI